MKKILITLLTILLCSAVFAQGRLIRKGDANYERGNYVAALNYYKKAESKGSSDADMLARIGVCYYFMENYDKSGAYFEKAGKDNINETQLMFYGIIKQSNGNYEQALSLFKDAKSKGNSAPVLDNMISSCTWAKANNNKIEGISIEIEEYNINGPAMGIRFWGDKVVFAANPENKKSLITTPMDLYYASYGNNSIGRAFELAYNLIYPYREGGVCFADNNKTMYFTKEEMAGGGEFILKIYQAKFDGSKWRDIEELPFNNSSYSCAYPTVSPDGNIMVFSSDAQGGKGGFDLWVTQKVGDSWGNIINLADLNTETDESFPYIDNNDILFFASKGHPGFGGYDIFYSLPQGGKWMAPQNALKPINSPRNDFAFALNPKKQEEGFICSNRAGNGVNDHFHELSVEADIFLNDIKEKIANTNQSNTLTDNENTKTEAELAYEERKKALLKKYNVRRLSELSREDRAKFNDELNNPEKYDAIESGRESLISTTTTRDNNTRNAENNSDRNTENNTSVPDNTNVRIDENTGRPDYYPYNTEENSNPDNNQSEDVVFKVQILSATRPVKNKLSLNGQAADKYFYKGLYRYTIGSFTDVPSADVVKKQAQSQGYYDAFVAVFDKNTGKRIPDYVVYGGNFTSMGDGSNSGYSSDGVILKVQLISTKKPIRNIPVVNGIQAESYYHQGMHKYTIGVYEDLSAAEQMRQAAIRAGYKGAFLVAFDKATNLRKVDYIIYNR